MHCLAREDFGVLLNEAGLLDAGVEIGAGAGHFAALLLRKWRGRRLILLDGWEPQSASNYLDIYNLSVREHASNRAACARLADADPRVELLQEFSPAAADRFEDETFDFVYLDGNHSYLAVRDDLRAWFPKVRRGGYFAGHDYIDGVRGGCLYGVRPAVDEFAQELDRAVAFTTADPPFRSWYIRKPLGPPPPPGRITLLTAHDRGLVAVGEISRANKEGYCRRHGYRFVCRTEGFDPDRPPSWSKVRFVQQELDRAEWVFWTDADSLVMNGTITLNRFLDDAVDVILSDDPYHGINMGCFFVHDSAWARGFLDRVYAQTAFLHHPWWENAAVLALYQQDAEVRKHVAVVPNKLFNGFPYEGGNYSPGDFIVHFPGLAEREAAMRDYAARAR